MLVSLAKLLGMSGLIAGIFYLLYKQILSLGIFSKLTKQQTYRLIMTMAVLTWLLAVFWLFGDTGINIINGDNNQITQG
ncbi:MAG: hypothetical protein GY789_22560 [Hyphomicrobiales bacterium]|nr:hypothetical protein [Hyphomicrobiales bacterium]MCP4997425.1 hypothetical protein [Hyphomicrobiales bacterium]